jgi:anti-sigma factor RsiW
VSGRLGRRLDAYRDGELSPRERERVERWLAADADSARHVAQTDALGGAIREAWREGPAAPSPELLIAVLRPELARVDAELAGAGRLWLEAWLSSLRRLLAPAPAAAFAAACAVLLLLAMPAEVGLPVNPTRLPPPALEAGVEDTPIYDLAQGDQPLMIMKGEDGSTVIWILEDEEHMSGLVADGWA